MIEITINNWDKYQLRKDVKSSSWFRFQHNFFVDHKFYGLDNDEKIVWLNVLCAASIESKAKIFYNLTLAAKLANVTERKVRETLKKLESFQCVTLQTRTRTVNDTDTCLQTDRQTDRQTCAFSDEISEVVSHLNNASSKKFKTTSAKTRSLVTSKMNEKYSVEDFKHVIDVKCQQWLGNPDMSKFLRPETLFGNKFENYLNEKKEMSVDDYDNKLIELMGGE